MPRNSSQFITAILFRYFSLDDISPDPQSPTACEMPDDHCERYQCKSMLNRPTLWQGGHSQQALSSSIIVAAVRCRPLPVSLQSSNTFKSNMSGPSVSKLQFGRRRSRGGASFGELRGRSGFSSSRRARRAATPGSRWRREPRPPIRRSANRSASSPGAIFPQEWWALFKSPALNALIQQSLNNNPSLQTALANLRAARQAVYAQEGKFFPLVDANFNPTRQLTAGPITPVLNTAANPFNLYTAQVGVAYTFDVWGLNRREVEVAQGAGRQPALPGRGGLPHADVKRGDRGHHRGVAARADRGHQRADRRQHQDARHHCSASSPPATPIAAT